VSQEGEFSAKTYNGMYLFNPSDTTGPTSCISAK
jgi:hypothetical protein